jgi:hypothetical protein
VETPPELINKLRELVQGQYIEADRALCGRGELMLAPSYAKHQLTVDVWKCMTAEQRRKTSRSCFGRHLKVPSTMSSDGILLMPTTPGAGKKQNQRKRHRTERTTNICRTKIIRSASFTEDAQESNGY